MLIGNMMKNNQLSVSIIFVALIMRLLLFYKCDCQDFEIALSV